MLKNVQTTAQLDSFHMIGKLKILQVRLQQYENFQMFKLDLEKAEEPGNGNPLQYSCLENPMGRGAW